MKVLIYTASSFCNPQFGIQMEHAIEYAKKGDEVIFCYCAGVMSACSANPFKNRAFCSACKLGFNAGLKNLPSTVRVAGIKNTSMQIRCSKKIFKSVADIKSYQYKGVDVGFSVMSVYISKTRNPNPEISETFLESINQLIFEAEKLIDAAEKIIIKENPDLIIFFNGRFFDTKPFHNLAEKYNVDYISTENIGGIRTGEEYRMVEFNNTIPHDSNIIYKNILQSWNQSTIPEEEKKKIGESFYIKRRNGLKAGDYVYTALQKIGKLPKEFDAKKKNIIIFTSSEDEFSSVSKKVDEHYIFSSQYECIKYLSENINDESYHFYVRIHPNMKGLNVNYHKNLYLLRDKKNVTIIPPEADTSSYTLIDNAHNILVFGSTIGAESMFWEKPVVLLGFAAYYDWGCCSIPHSKQEIIYMVKNPIIFPAAKDMAVKYGYYVMENNISKSSIYLNITPHKEKLFGKELYVFDYLKVLKSSLLYRFISTFIYRVVRVFFKNKIEFPEKIIH